MAGSPKKRARKAAGGLPPRRGPYKLDAERAGRVIDAVLRGNFLETAAGYAGIRAATLREWLARGRRDLETGQDTASARFVRDVDRAQSESESRHVERIENASVAADPKDAWKASAWLLEKRHPERWGTRTRVIVEGELEELFRRLKGSLPADVYALVVEAASSAGQGAGEGEGDAADEDLDEATRH